ncbi:MAG: hypothetical protein HYZ75_02995 [Elusimicrobia bacterium]|nr:hypothetical protein [Elusimicrobiota bacterium]
MRARRLLAALLVSSAALSTACKPPKYIKYSSEAGDFTAEVPWGWSVYLDRQGDDYYNYTFVGPFDADFHRGVPTLQVRWYGKNRVRTLPDGTIEAYASPQDFIARTLRDVYGPGRVFQVEPQRVEVSNWEATHFVVVAPMDAPPGLRFGLSEERGTGKNFVVRQHAYVVLPMDSGFYVLIYPATRAGFDKYKERLNTLVNTFRTLKDGPGGPAIR